MPTTVTNAVSWRSEGIKYKKNEVFIDVIESINVLVRQDVGLFVRTFVLCVLVLLLNFKIMLSVTLYPAVHLGLSFGLTV